MATVTRHSRKSATKTKVRCRTTTGYSKTTAINLRASAAGDADLQVAGVEEAAVTRVLCSFHGSLES